MFSYDAPMAFQIHFCLTIITKTRQNDCDVYMHAATSMESTCDHDRQCERLQGMLYMSNGDCIIETQ